VPHKEEITMMWWYGNGMSGWGYLMMAVSTVVFWGVLIAGGIAVFRSMNRSPANPGSAETRPTPERLLAERFANGEIDEEEYRRRLDTLRGTGPVARS